MAKVLVIDDEKTILDNLKFVLELNDYSVITASTGEDGINIFKAMQQEIDVVVTDMRLPHFSGMAVLREIKKTSPQTGVIIITGHGDMENAIKAMKEGAFEYLKKPVNADDLVISINNAIANKHLLLENMRMQQEIAEYNSYFKSLLDSAQKILLNMIPKKLPVIPGFRLTVEYKSSDAVGGDMFNIFDTGDRLLFYIFDVSSHGILASLITIIAKSFIQNIRYNYKNKSSPKELNEIISDLNRELYENTAQNVFVSLFMGIIDKQTKEFTYVSAGHINQYVSTAAGLVTLPSTGTLLGVFDDAEFSCQRMKLEYGDKILLFTDGIIEASDNSGENYGEERLCKIVEANHTSPIEDVTKMIFKASANHAEWDFQDDITILGIEIS